MRRLILVNYAWSQFMKGHDFLNHINVEMRKFYKYRFGDHETSEPIDTYEGNVRNMIKILNYSEVFSIMLLYLKNQDSSPECTLTATVPRGRFTPRRLSL